jgi:hypothetical protein
MKDRYDDLEPYMDSAFKGIHHHNGLCVLFDGMDGKYVAIGRVLAKTKDHQGFGGPVVVQADDDDGLKERIRELLAAEVADIQTLVISHYR